MFPTKDDTVAGFYTINYEEGLLIGTLKGKIKGNGVKFKWSEVILGKSGTDSGEGFMIMKENKKDVYLKQGTDRFVGNYTAGKKKEIEIKNVERNDDLWLGKWKLDIYDESILVLDKFEDGYIGYYTLKGYKHTYMTSGLNATTFHTTKMPDRTVLIIGFPVGDTLYYITNNYVENVIKTGIITLSEDKKSFKGQEIDTDLFGVKWKNSFCGKRF